jgi:hypothetical protein
VSKRGGAIYITGNTQLHINDSKIEKNIAEQIAGIRVESNSSMHMTNTFVIDNWATTGGIGAIRFNQSSGRIVNATVAGNYSVDYPGGIYFYTDQIDQSLSIVNSILYFNGDDDLYCTDGACQVTYSDVQEGIIGEGNISVDPLFVSRFTGDYHIQSSSPVKNAGTSVGAPEFDFEGDPRPIGGVDMGADEIHVIYTHTAVLPFVVR